MGLLLAVVVHAADIQDRDGASSLSEKHGWLAVAGMMG